MNTAFKIRRINVSLTWQRYDHDLTTGEAWNTAEKTFGAPLKVKLKAFEFGQKLPPFPPPPPPAPALLLSNYYHYRSLSGREIIWEDCYCIPILITTFLLEAQQYETTTAELRDAVRPSCRCNSHLLLLPGTLQHQVSFKTNGPSQLGLRVDDLRRDWLESWRCSPPPSRRWRIWEGLHDVAVLPRPPTTFHLDTLENRRRDQLIIYICGYFKTSSFTCPDKVYGWLRNVCCFRR